MGKGDTKEHLDLVDKFVQLNNTEHLTTTYPLDGASVIFDVGAYDGRWALRMHDLYRCIVHCFEPVKANFALLQENTEGVAEIMCHHFALGAKNDTRKIHLQKDGSSFFDVSDACEDVQERDMVEVMSELDLTHVDLLKMNIEGAEFDLLEHLIAYDMIKKFLHIQIQYHREAPNFDARRKFIQDEFRKTHSVNFDYDFVWESWSRNG